MRFALVFLAACGTSEHVFTLDELPVTEWTGGLPVDGDGRLLVWLARTDWSDAVGFVRFRCEDCMLGDARTKLAVPGFDTGIEFGRLSLGDVRAALDFGDGRVKLTTTWRSSDFELDATITGLLSSRAEDISLDGCIVFRPTGTLLEHDPKGHALASLTGAPIGEDGRYTIRISGTLGEMRRLGQICHLDR